MTDRNRFHLHILPGMPVTRENFRVPHTPRLSQVLAAMGGILGAYVEARAYPGGAQPGMCPNCITPWKCNGPHEPSPRN